MKYQYDYKHVLLLNLVSILVSSSAIFGKLITLHAAQIVLFRCILGAFFLFLFLKFKKVKLWKSFFQNKGFFIVSGIFLGAHWVFLFKAVQISTVSIAILAVFTFPVITTLLEPLFFKMKLVWFNLVTALLVLVGLSFLVPEYSLENQTSVGVFLGVISALLIAIRNLLSKKYIETISGPEIMYHQVWIAALILIPAFWIAPVDWTLKNGIYLLSMGLVTTAIGHTLFVYCLKFFRASTASIITSIQPFYGILLAVVFLQESLHRHLMIGGAIIVGSVLLENVKAGLTQRPA